MLHAIVLKLLHLRCCWTLLGQVWTLWTASPVLTVSTVWTVTGHILNAPTWQMSHLLSYPSYEILLSDGSKCSASFQHIQRRFETGQLVEVYMGRSFGWVYGTVAARFTEDWGRIPSIPSVQKVDTLQVVLVHDELAVTIPSFLVRSRPAIVARIWNPTDYWILKLKASGVKCAKSSGFHSYVSYVKCLEPQAVRDLLPIFSQAAESGLATLEDKSLKKFTVKSHGLNECSRKVKNAKGQWHLCLSLLSPFFFVTAELMQSQWQWECPVGLLLVEDCSSVPRRWQTSCSWLSESSWPRGAVA